jgi:HK97 family phage prohead protease
MSRKYIDRPFEVKEVSEDGTFVGYGSVFGEVDWGRDVVMPGAFKESLRDDFEKKNRAVPMLWQHDSRNPIGIYPTIKEDKTGLLVTGACNMDVQQGRECHALMKQGALTGLSIGYITEDDEWDDAQMVRKLVKLRLYEISPVTFPMNDSARVSAVKTIKELASIRDVEKYLRDEGFSRDEFAALIAAVKAHTAQRESAGGDVAAAAVKRAAEILRGGA